MTMYAIVCIVGGYMNNNRQITQRKNLLLVLLCCCLFFASTIVSGEEGGKKAQIFFTHDVHSHLEKYRVAKEDGTAEYVGGLAKLSTMLKEYEDKDCATLLLDAGDFSMGTLYQTIYEGEAVELLMLGRLGYDATTFGNHEFDYRTNGLVNMLHTALQKSQEGGYALPEILISNIDWDKNQSEDNKKLREAMEEYGCKSWTVLERDGLRVGIFGEFGENSSDCAPESGLVFDNIVDSAKDTVKELQEQDVDLIICLSHSGTNPDPSKSEDEILAREVPEIDVIVSGHTHTRLDAYVQVGDTYIISQGCYAEFLGELDLEQTENGRWKVAQYALHRAEESVEEDKDILKDLAKYRKLIDSKYLSLYGYTYDQVLAYNQYDFVQMDKMGQELKEETLGSIIADSYVYAVRETEGENYEPVAFSVAPVGCIRDTLQKGKITVSDAFMISSLGVGADRIPGYPLLSVYLTGKEIRTAAEIDVSVSTLMMEAQLHPSGVHWEYNPHRLILNRVTDVWVQSDVPESDERIELEDDKLYRVVADLYSAQMLGAVEGKSKGILKIVPKDKQGEPITDFEGQIIYTSDKKELKAWYALAQYLESFEKTKNVSVIPERYNQPEGRKQLVDSRNPLQLLKHPNKISIAVYLILVVLILILILLVKGMIKVVRAIRRKHR